MKRISTGQKYRIWKKLYQHYSELAELWNLPLLIHSKDYYLGNQILSLTLCEINLEASKILLSKTYSSLILRSSSKYPLKFAWNKQAPTYYQSCLALIEKYDLDALRTYKECRVKHLITMNMPLDSYNPRKPVTKIINDFIIVNPVIYLLEN